jgi:hypothetical protein
LPRQYLTSENGFNCRECTFEHSIVNMSILLDRGGFGLENNEEQDPCSSVPQLQNCFRPLHAPTPLPSDSIWSRPMPLPHLALDCSAIIWMDAMNATFAI